jgi:hypothetical protein
LMLLRRELHKATAVFAGHTDRPDSARGFLSA